MHQMGPVDILLIAGVIAVGLVVERLLRGRLAWVEAVFWFSGRRSRENRPPRAKGVQEDDDMHWNWSARH
jgi:hypothetical protein